MAEPQAFLLGEFERTLDERYRLSVPSELGDLLTAESSDCILAKERPGCLSLWSAALWQAKLDEGVQLVQQKMRAGRLDGKLSQVQMLGRLLSTRHRAVQLAGRGRLLIPEGVSGVFRGGTQRGRAGGGSGHLHRAVAAGRLAEVPGAWDSQVPSSIQ